MTTSELPVTAVLAELSAHLEQTGTAVLCAPPGSGKTTRVPLALMEMPWLNEQSIIMLEPRRVAARAAAYYMAFLLGEPVGQRVGFRVRFESAVSNDTRVEVVTEGVLARRLQSDPELRGVGMVIFDEFHERSLECDLALALTLDVRESLRTDLRVLVMSATLDAEPVANLLGAQISGDERGQAPIVRTQGRSHPISIRFQAAARHDSRSSSVASEVSATVRTALAEHDQDVLVFLPGIREIQAVLSQLRGSVASDIMLCPLYGGLKPEAQDRAIIADADGRQRVVLATNIAETSLTIEGVGVVIDSGLARQPHFDPNSGLTRLRTINISRASADQRAGRAGRLGPGTAIRLWSASEHDARAAFDSAEITSADLCSLVLELARWGVNDAARLHWLDPPPLGAWQQAVELLRRLGALDHAARVTALGKRMAALPTHPRLARMLCAANNDEQRVLAANLAAALDGADPLVGSNNNADLRDRAEFLAGAQARNAHSYAVQRALRVAQQLRRSMRVQGTRSATVEDSGRLLLAGFPDRLAKRRAGAGSKGAENKGTGRFLLANGRGLRVDAADALGHCDYLVVPDLDAGAVDARAYRAAPVDLAIIRDVLGQQVEVRRRVAWNSREQAVEAVEEDALDSLVLRASKVKDASGDELCAAMRDGIIHLGLSALPWDPATAQLIERVQSLRHWQPNAGWLALDEESLLRDVDLWLLPYLHGITRRAHLSRLNLSLILHTHIGYRQLERVEQGAPVHLTVPSGSQVRLTYQAGKPPVLAVKLQEMFGAEQTPTVCWGEVPVLVQLLSPARRPLHITQDLPSFWANAYPEVCKEMRGRYPKHPWPEDPTAALPTRHTKRKGSPRPRSGPGSK
ncbi:MAG: ATP-dependent helicase HrpB [Gammaproteobacteria bacterium]|jgi:ATP-dependent helicase HrpB